MTILRTILFLLAFSTSIATSCRRFQERQLRMSEEDREWIIDYFSGNVPPATADMITSTIAGLGSDFANLNEFAIQEYLRLNETVHKLKELETIPPPFFLTNQNLSFSNITDSYQYAVYDINDIDEFNIIEFGNLTFELKEYSKLLNNSCILTIDQDYVITPCLFSLLHFQEKDIGELSHWQNATLIIMTYDYKAEDPLQKIIIDPFQYISINNSELAHMRQYGWNDTGHTENINDLLPSFENIALTAFVKYDALNSGIQLKEIVNDISLDQTLPQDTTLAILLKTQLGVYQRVQRLPVDTVKLNANISVNLPIGFDLLFRSTQANQPKELKYTTKQLVKQNWARQVGNTTGGTSTFPSFIIKEPALGETTWSHTITVGEEPRQVKFEFTWEKVIAPCKNDSSVCKDANGMILWSFGYSCWTSSEYIGDYTYLRPRTVIIGSNGGRVNFNFKSHKILKSVKVYFLGAVDIIGGDYKSSKMSFVLNTKKQINSVLSIVNSSVTLTNPTSFSEEVNGKRLYGLLYSSNTRVDNIVTIERAFAIDPTVFVREEYVGAGYFSSTQTSAKKTLIAYDRSRPLSNTIVGNYTLLIHSIPFDGYCNTSASSKSLFDLELSAIDVGAITQQLMNLTYVHFDSLQPILIPYRDKGILYQNSDYNLAVSTLSQLSSRIGEQEIYSETVLDALDSPLDALWNFLIVATSFSEISSVIFTAKQGSKIAKIKKTLSSSNNGLTNLGDVFANSIKSVVELSNGMINPRLAERLIDSVDISYLHGLKKLKTRTPEFNKIPLEGLDYDDLFEMGGKLKNDDFLELGITNPVMHSLYSSTLSNKFLQGKEFQTSPFGSVSIYSSPIDELGGLGRALHSASDPAEFILSSSNKFPYHTSLNIQTWDLEEVDGALEYVFNQRYLGAAEPSILGPTNGLSRPVVKLGFIKFTNIVDDDTGNILLLPWHKTRKNDLEFYTAIDVDAIFKSFAPSSLANSFSTDERWDYCYNKYNALLGNRVQVTSVPVQQPQYISTLDNLFDYRNPTGGPAFKYNLFKNNCQDVVRDVFSIVTTGILNSRTSSNGVSAFLEEYIKRVNRDVDLIPNPLLESAFPPGLFTSAVTRKCKRLQRCTPSTKLKRENRQLRSTINIEPVLDV